VDPEAATAGVMEIEVKVAADSEGVTVTMAT
jgi:hypothetical protein